MKELKEMELLRKISSKFICIGSNPLKNAEVFYIGGSDTLPPPLKKDEEEALMKKLANGDMSVKATLIERNLRLVVYIARKFENTGIYVEDLISIGTIGLIKAINTFNPLKNIKLATYASRCIENEILMYLRKNSNMRSEVSIDEPLNVDWDGNELLLSDILGTDNDVICKNIEDEVDKALLVDAMKKLSVREQQIMRLRFGLGNGKEKNKLFIKIKNGDLQARETFVKGNLRLVLSVIQRFNNRGENVDDLFQVGCIGLIKAIDNFDLSQNVQFSTYAVPMIIGEIRRYLRDNNSIRVSRSLKDIAYKAMHVKERLISKNSKEPTISEIAKELDLPKEDVVFALDAIADPVSLFEPIYHDGGEAIYVMDQVKDTKNVDENWLENIALSEAMKHLDEREKHILNLRFFQSRTQMEVAEEIGISQAQVSRLEKSALKQLRKYV